MPKSTLMHFFQATRPRTYPIAIMSLAVGQMLAYRTLDGFGWANWAVVFLAIYVALSLQILSNLANDYGDGVRGTDTHRHSDSPKRLIGGGVISPTIFKKWLIIWLIQTMMAGGVLIAISALSAVQIAVFFGLGLVCILGAFGYTMGKKPYGYQAMGELAVLLFFGYVAVLGGYYLQVGRTDIGQNIIIATGVGLLSACVLYINNLRDVDTDPMSGKITLAVLLGKYKITTYFVLFFVALACYVCHLIVNGGRVWVLALCLPLIIKHIYHTHKHRQNPAMIGKELGVIVQLVILMNFLVIFFI